MLSQVWACVKYVPKQSIPYHFWHRATANVRRERHRRLIHHKRIYGNWKTKIGFSLCDSTANVDICGCQYKQNHRDFTCGLMDACASWQWWYCCAHWLADLIPLFGDVHKSGVVPDFYGWLCSMSSANSLLVCLCFHESNSRFNASFGNTILEGHCQVLQICHETCPALCHRIWGLLTSVASRWLKSCMMDSVCVKGYAVSIAIICASKSVCIWIEETNAALVWYKLCVYIVYVYMFQMIFELESAIRWQYGSHYPGPGCCSIARNSSCSVREAKVKMPAFKILDSFAAPSEAQTKGDGVDTAHANKGNVRIVYIHTRFWSWCIYIYISIYL